MNYLATDFEKDKVGLGFALSVIYSVSILNLMIYIVEFEIAFP